MWSWMFAATAMAATPTPIDVELGWGKTGATLKVVAKPGFKVAPEAPASFDASMGAARVLYEIDGEALIEGWSLGTLPHRSLKGELMLGVCDQAGTCRQETYMVEGTVPSKPKKGVLSCNVSSLQPDSSHATGSPFGKDADVNAVERAFAAAKKDGKPVLLDFSAAWCPPCNLLAAEVLHADPLDSEIEAVHVAVIDVDHRSSWTLKDKYDVGGYPTIILVDPDGTEKSRTVGYDDRPSFLGWLNDAMNATDAADIAAGPDSVTPERAAELALYLAKQREFKTAKTFLEVAADNRDRGLAQLMVEPNLELLERMIDEAPDAWDTLAGAALELGDDAAELHDPIMELANEHAIASELVVVLYFQAYFKPKEERPAAFGRAALALQGQFTGDPDHDRAHVSWLASLHRDANRPHAAEALLKEFVGHFPDEPTFHTSLSRHFMALEQPKDALTHANAAKKLAWGDSLLTATSMQVKALLALDRKDDAAAAVEEALDAVPEPEENVRTSRYRERLLKLVEEDEDQ